MPTPRKSNPAIKAHAKAAATAVGAASTKAITLPSGALTTVKTPTKSQVKRAAAKIDAPNLSEADVQRIVRAFQTAEAPKVSGGSDPVASDVGYNKKERKVSIPEVIEDLAGELSALRGALGDLQQKLEPVLGPINEGLCGEISPDVPTSPALERLTTLVREVRNARYWVNGIRDRAEL